MDLNDVINEYMSLEETNLSFKGLSLNTFILVNNN